MHVQFRHPLARHAAGTVLGYRADGRPIYPIAGGATPAEPVPPAAPAAPAAPAPTPAAPAAPAPSGEDPAAAIARLEKQLADARKDAGAARTTAKATAADEARTALVQDLGKALGLIKDGEAADPAALTQKLTAAQAEARATLVELAVHKAASAAGADAGALLDSRSFLATLKEIDPKDTKAVSDAIAAAVKDNPKLGAAPQAGAQRSGAELTGGPGQPPKARPTSLGAALGAHYNSGR